jgi:hypothetical protein
MKPSIIGSGYIGCGTDECSLIWAMRSPLIRTNAKVFTSTGIVGEALARVDLCGVTVGPCPVGGVSIETVKDLMASQEIIEGKKFV